MRSNLRAFLESDLHGSPKLEDPDSELGSLGPKFAWTLVLYPSYLLTRSLSEIFEGLRVKSGQAESGVGLRLVIPVTRYAKARSDWGAVG